VIWSFFIVIGNGGERLIVIALGNWHPITFGPPVTQSGPLFHDISEREIVDSCHADQQQIAVFVGHEIATHNHFGTPNRCPKSGLDGSRLMFQCDSNRDSRALAEQAVIDLSAIYSGQETRR
jgi:hypothetical protein